MQWDNHAEYSIYKYKSKGGRGECGYNTNYLVIVARVRSRMRECHPTFLPYIPLDPTSDIFVSMIYCAHVVRIIVATRTSSR